MADQRGVDYKGYTQLRYMGALGYCSEVCCNPDNIEPVKEAMASGINDKLSDPDIPNAATIVSDIISLNLSAFLMAPVIAKLGFCTEDEFLDRRRQENIDTILLKLKHSSL